MKQHLRNIPNNAVNASMKTTDVDETLRDLEAQAWDAYHHSEKKLAIKQPAPALEKFLATRILPGFYNLGFANEFTRSLICIAASAWETLAGIPDQVVGLHPIMRKDLDEVRQGLLIQSDRRMASDLEPTFMTPQTSYDAVRQSMDPANLHRVLDEVSTPWIILPRAYNALKREQAHCLPAYLEMIEKETNEEALHIFTRIAIEFLSNFSIRFADKPHTHDQVARMVNAGYSAMFWKSLHTPPRGFEDVRLFDHYLSWLKHSDGRPPSADLDTGAKVMKMEAYREMLFPLRSKGRHDQPKRPDRYRFSVALRHGCLGIDSTVHYFAAKPLVTGVPFDQGMAWGTFLFDLKSLFDQLAAKYPTESKRTQYYIREFLFQLENAFALTLFYDTGTPSDEAASLKFVQAKVTGMILQLKQDLALVS